jgi:hypothetical protein
MIFLLCGGALGHVIIPSRPFHIADTSIGVLLHAVYMMLENDGDNLGQNMNPARFERLTFRGFVACSPEVTLPAFCVSRRVFCARRGRACRRQGVHEPRALGQPAGEGAASEH